MAFTTVRLWRSCRQLRKYSSYHPRQAIASNNEFFHISEEVRDALHAKKPVVALETTIYTHGFPYPENIALASELESIVRVNGGVPATIGILGGVAKVGFDPEELIRLVSTAGQADTLKLSRRDLSYACGLRLAGKSFNGGTTIAGTCILAHLAGIKVFATGGLGGVHRGGESSMDISADLTELGRTPVAVVSSGCKSFLDIPRTLEYLETEGVAVATFADGREGKVDFPAFWSRDSGVRSPVTIQTEKEAAAMIYAQNKLQLSSGLHFANPIPAEAAIPNDENNTLVAEAIRQADAAGSTGKDNTPFILNKIKALSGGRSVQANRVLIASNVKRGTLVAKELTKLELEDRDNKGTAERAVWKASPAPPNLVATSSTARPRLHETNGPTSNRTTEKAEIIIAGALAVDYACDYYPPSTSPSQASPTLHTSNPARIHQSLGGVAHNIARAAHLVGTNVKLCSILGDDLSGRTALQQLEAEGMDSYGIRTVNGERTAQYVAVNDAQRELVVAMADMGILERQGESLVSKLREALQKDAPKWLAIDGNLDSKSLLEILKIAKGTGARTAFEPVSTAKSVRIFESPIRAKDATASNQDSLPVFPNYLIDIVTPNHLELAAMHSAAREAGYFERQDWWKVIDAMGIPASGARDRFVMSTTREMVDRGIPQQSIQLLPFMPCVLTKLGQKGVFMTMLLGRDDQRLSDGDIAPYIISRSRSEDSASAVGGVYMRLFSPPEILSDADIVSVNGVGDTFLGALIAASVKTGKSIENLVDLAQQAALLTLKSREAVSPTLGRLRNLL